MRDPSRRQLPVSERIVEVIDTRLTGETILDEALKMMKQHEATGEKIAVNTWIDLLSGTSFSVHSPHATDASQRGDMERDENRLSAEASPGAASKGTRR